MSEIITRETPLVKVLTAAAMGQNKGSADVYNAKSAVRDFAIDGNRVAIAQLTKYAIEDLATKIPAWREQIADVKPFTAGEQMRFVQNLGGITAYIQTQGSTTPRSKVISKTFTVDPVFVSVRPHFNIGELSTGRVDLTQTIADAYMQLEVQKNKYIFDAMNTAISSYSSPEYTTGASGVNGATLKSQIQAYSRIGDVTLIGDIYAVGQLAGETGFTAGTDLKSFAGNIMSEQQARGYVGTFEGANVVKLDNGYIDGDWTNIAFDKKVIFVVPAGLSGAQRPLKIGEGAFTYLEQTNIDDMSYEVRIDQVFGVGVVKGKQCLIGMHKDTSV